MVQATATPDSNSQGRVFPFFYHAKCNPHLAKGPHVSRACKKSTGCDKERQSTFTDKGSCTNMHPRPFGVGCEDLVGFLWSVSIVWLDDFQFHFSRWREPDVKFVLDIFWNFTLAA